MNLIAEIKKGILTGIAKSGGRGFITEHISDAGIRAVSELIHEGLIREDDSDESGILVLVITRKGAEAAEERL